MLVSNAVEPMLWKPRVPILGEVEFPAYMTLLMLGFTLAIWLARREEDRSGRNGDRIVDLGLIMLVAGVFGARILSVLADGRLQDFVNLCLDPKLVPAEDAPARYRFNCVSDAQCEFDYLCDLATRRCYPARDCLKVFKFWHGGLAFYGGLLFAAPVGLWYAHRKKLGVWRVADLTAPFIALGLFFGRLGCFLNGCCFGKQTDLPWAVTFPQRGTPPNVHPAQLYESFGALVLFGLLYFVVRPRKSRHGEVFAWLLITYGLLRFGLEFLRADERGSLWLLSTSQWLGVPVGACGLWLLFRGKRREVTT